MSDLEIKRRNLKVRIYDKDFDLRKPSVSQVEDLLEKQNLDEFKGKDIKLMKEFLSACGLPQDVASDMDADDFNELANFLIDATKKKLVQSGTSTPS